MRAIVCVHFILFHESGNYFSRSNVQNKAVQIKKCQVYGFYHQVNDG
jgi:hypothetical protein